MTKLVMAILILGAPVVYGETKNQVLIYETVDLSKVPGEMKNGRTFTIKSEAADEDVVERTINRAIKSLENSMRKTCAKEMETSITITAGGQWGIAGVSITGAIKLVIKNPEVSPKCAK